MTAHDHAAELKTIRETLGMKLEPFAKRLGVTWTTYKNYEYGQVKKIPDTVMEKARAMLAPEVSVPKIPAAELRIPIPFIGLVAASQEVDWTDPLEAGEFEFVPAEMGDGRNRFACRVAGDSMIPLLYPDDVLVFVASNVPKLGIVVLFRSEDHRICVKQLKHDGERFFLHSLNSAYEPQSPKGTVIGHLIGIVREIGSRRTTEYDPAGIRP